MRRSRRPPLKKADSDSEERDPSKSVVFLSSSDDEEANKDWSLEIVERARERELKRKRAEDREVISISPASPDYVEMNFERNAAEEKKGKKSKGKNRKKKEVEAAEAVESVSRSNSSSHDEEANKDWSLEIVKRARERELKGRRAEDREVISISPASSDDVEMNFDWTAAEEKKEKKSKGKNKKKKEVEATAAAEAEDSVSRSNSSRHNEEANKDWSLEILERARERELKRKRTEDREVISISPVSSDDVEMNFDQTADEEKKEKKSKGKNKKEKEFKATTAAAVESVDAALKEEEPVGTTDSVITELNEVPDNAVLRKLMRGPRYFDPGERDSGACFNCGEEGHAAVNCTMERRKKPCFVCGMFGHNAKRCTQGQDCFICKRRGHIAKNCPDKNKRTPQDSTICLRCGDFGHDMQSCKNDYAPDDLKEIQCYVCKNYGHLCCVDFVDNIPREVSCYNCAQSGHTGIGCAKPRGDLIDTASSTLCYKCGEEGHFARGCTKNSKCDRWEGSSSTRRAANENIDSLGFRSVPRDFGKAQKKKKKMLQYEDKYEDRWNMRSGKSRIKGGWIVDDPGDSFERKQKANRWRSPSTSSRNNHKVYSSPSRGHYSMSQSPFKKYKSFLGTPSSYSSASSHLQGYSTPRYYGKSQDHFGRT